MWYKSSLLKLESTSKMQPHPTVCKGHAVKASRWIWPLTVHSTFLFSDVLQPCPVTDSSLVAMAAPQLGSVHAVYFDPTEEEGPREWTTPTHPTWLRGRVIASRYSDSHQQEVVVLAIDYGFVFIASMTKLHPLPHACQGIIHQVRLGEMGRH